MRSAATPANARLASWEMVLLVNLTMPVRTSADAVATQLAPGMPRVATLVNATRDSFWKMKNVLRPMNVFSTWTHAPKMKTALTLMAVTNASAKKASKKLALLV